MMRLIVLTGVANFETPTENYAVTMQWEIALLALQCDIWLSAIQ